MLSFHGSTCYFPSSFYLFFSLAYQRAMRSESNLASIKLRIALFFQRRKTAYYSITRAQASVELMSKIQHGPLNYLTLGDQLSSTRGYDQHISVFSVRPNLACNQSSISSKVIAK